MRQTIKYKNTTWIDIYQPDKEDLEFLRTHFKFHPITLSELIRPSFFPQVRLFGRRYLYLVIYYPVYDKVKRETRPRELDIIVTKNTIITSHYQSILPLKAIWDKCVLYEDQKKKYLGQGSSLLLFYILKGILKNCLLKVNRIEQKIDSIEQEIFQNKEKEMVQEISFVKTDIIDFYRIIEPQKDVMESLPFIAEEFWGEEVSPYFSEVIGTFGIIWNQLETFKDTITGLEETNNSLLSTKINEVIKVLTIFSVILMPLNLLASMLGMNLINLPFAHHPWGFWLISFIMAGIAIAMILYFKKKRWI